MHYGGVLCEIVRHEQLETSVVTDQLLKLKNEMDTSIVLVTHNLGIASNIADRIGIMIKGRLVKLGTLEELENATGKKGLEEVFVAVAEED